MKRTSAILGWLLLTAGSLAAQIRGEADAGFGRTELYGLATASLFIPVAGPVQFELTGLAQGQQNVGRTNALSGLAGGRMHFVGRDAGLWLGLSAGANRLGSEQRWEAGAWKAIGALSIQVQGWQTNNGLSWSSRSPDTAPTFPDTLTPTPQGRQSTVRSATDLGIWTHWSRGRAELRLASGMRFGTIARTIEERKLGSADSAPSRSVSSTWWMAEGILWMTPRVGLVTSIGQLPIDPAVAATGEQFLRVGFRASLQPHRGAPLVVSPVPASTGAFRTRKHLNDEVEFMLLDRRAGQVELMADFTGWEPVHMEKAGGRWRLRLPVAPGIHRINVRYDGGVWLAPPDTRVVQDEFGQDSGEMVI